MTEIFTRPQILEMVQELVIQYGFKGASDRLRIEEAQLRAIVKGTESIKRVLVRLGLTAVYIRKKEIDGHKD